MVFSLQDFLFLIGMQARTGELVMESGNNIGTILFYQGKIRHAFSPYSRAIGDLLVEAGVITDTELIEMLMLQKKNPVSPLGSLLLKSGKITFEVIEMMVHEQIRRALKEFQCWKDIKFSFAYKDIKPFDRIQLTVHEFIRPEVLQSAVSFLAAHAQPPGVSPPITSQSIEPIV